MTTQIEDVDALSCAVGEALGLFPSVIQSGEAWSGRCEEVRKNASAALGRLKVLAKDQTDEVYRVGKPDAYEEAVAQIDRVAGGLSDKNRLAASIDLGLFPSVAPDRAVHSWLTMRNQIADLRAQLRETGAEARGES